MSDTTGKQKHTYIDAGRKIQDATSTAWSFLFLGILGIAAIIHIWTGGFPLDFSFMTLMLASIIPGILFLIFIIMSVHSFHNRKKYILEKTKEDAIVGRVRKWFQENYSADAISNGMDEEDIPLEELYYLRSENIGRLLEEEFPELDESFLEYLLENIYQMYFYDEEFIDIQR